MGINGGISMSSTDHNPFRAGMIKALLESFRIPFNTSTMFIYKELLKNIPDDKIKQFVVETIRNDNTMMRPDTAISNVVRKYEAEIFTNELQAGTRTFKELDTVKDFCYHYFKGKRIANDIEGLYQPSVTVAMNRDSELVNQYSGKKLTSDDEILFWKWLFVNQHKIGVIKEVKSKFEELGGVLPFLKDKDEPVMIEQEPIHPKVAGMLQKIGRS